MVDDCSTDNTIELLQNYPVKVLSTLENSGGPNKGRNLGLEASTGDFICIADHDDVWKPNKLASILKVSDKAPIISSGYALIDENTKKRIKRVKTGVGWYVKFPKNKTFLNKLLRKNDAQITYLGSLVYSSKLKHIRFEENFGVVDFDWILRLFHKHESIEVCEILYDRYVEGTNLSLNGPYRRKDYFYSLMCLEEYEDEYKSQVITSVKRINGTRARYFYYIGDMKKARKYFLKSQFNLKTLLYLVTTFYGSQYMKKNYNIFG